MKKYRPLPLPKHWLTGKKEKPEFEFSADSAIAILFGPLTLISLNPWLAVGLAVIDVIAIVLIQFLLLNSFFSISLIIIALILLIANHYLCAWLRNVLIERRK